MGRRPCRAATRGGWWGAEGGLLSEAESQAPRGAAPCMDRVYRRARGNSRAWRPATCADARDFYGRNIELTCAAASSCTNWIPHILHAGVPPRVFAACTV
eukprot:915923-Prymnesium_polylepis.1